MRLVVSALVAIIIALFVLGMMAVFEMKRQNDEIKRLTVEKHRREISARIAREIQETLE